MTDDHEHETLISTEIQAQHNTPHDHTMTCSIQQAQKYLHTPQRTSAATRTKKKRETSEEARVIT